MGSSSSSVDENENVAIEILTDDELDSGVYCDDHIPTINSLVFTLQTHNQS